MKVLWLSNVLFPEACNELNIPAPVIGGWMQAGAEALLKCNLPIELCVAALYPGKQLQLIKKYTIAYYLIPSKGGDQSYNHLFERYYLQIKNDFQPDIIHIHGSEYPHSLAWIRACGNRKVLVSIQGLVSIYAKFFFGGIPERELKQNITLRDVVRRDSLLAQQRRMFERGEYERELLNKVQHVIGRTSWDKSNTWAINPDARYHVCNETLRPAFYKSKWKYENCIKHSIFLSQGHYPIKGIHQVIKAFKIVKKVYPNAKIYVAGEDFYEINVPKKEWICGVPFKIDEATWSGSQH